MRYVYSPTTAIIALLSVMEDGASAGIAMVGNEGILGICLFMGGNTTPSRAVVQSAGHGRLKANSIKVEFEHYGPTMRLLLRYTQALDNPDGANGSLQPASFGGPAIVPVAVAEP